jgi:hypothetical protein
MRQESTIRSGNGCAGVACLLALALLAASCGSPPPPDPYCSSAPLPSDVKVKTGQGALQVDGTTAVQFLVFDLARKPVDNKLLGRTVAVGPGKYRVTVNNTVHTVTVEGGKLTRCATGTLLVTGTTDDTWFVQELSGAAVEQTRLGKPLSLMPGTFRVKVNNTVTTAEVKLNQVTELKTGSLVAEGSGDGHYHVTDQAGASLEYKQFDRALSLFPGEYNVEVGESTRAARIEAGRETRLKF